MSNEQKFTTQLTLPYLPATTGIPPAAYAEILTIYNVIKSLAFTLDELVGVDGRTGAERQEFFDGDIRASAVIEQFSTIYLPFAQDAQYGQLMSVDFSGQGVLALASGAASAPFPIGFCAEEEVLLGQYGKICTRGIIGINGVIPGDYYYASETTPGNIANGAVTYTIPIAVGIRTNALFFYGFSNSTIG